MDESLCLECINNSIERREVHSWLSFFSDEFTLEFRKSHSRFGAEDFDKSFSLFGDSVFRHEEERLKKRGREVLYVIFL
jgi:hypothetical protein